jgi:hypothetical protein
VLHPAIVANGEGSIHGVCLVATRRNLPAHMLDAIERARSKSQAISKSQNKDEHGNP